MVVVCDLENLKNEEAMTRVGSQCHRKNIINITTLFIVRGCVLNPPDGHYNQYVHKLATPKAAIATKLFHLYFFFLLGVLYQYRGALCEPLIAGI